MSEGVEMYSVYVALSFVGYCHLAIRRRCITRHPQGFVGEDKVFSFAIFFALPIITKRHFTTKLALDTLKWVTLVLNGRDSRNRPVQNCHGSTPSQHTVT